MPDSVQGHRRRRRGAEAAVAALILAALSARAAPASPPQSRSAFEARLAASRPGDLPKRFELAELAERIGLPGRAEGLYRTILMRDPEQDRAYRRLVDLAGERPLPRSSRAFQAVRRQLGAVFREHETKRFVVLSDADLAWTRAQLSRLERAHHQFLRFARRLGLHPLPLEHKLVCLLFQTRTEYADFARRVDHVDNPWIVGYYSVNDDRVVFYNGEAEQGADEFAQRRSIATTVHEAIHQILYHTHVQNRYVQYPIWITEGLATAFETDTPGTAFGPAYEYEPRRTRFERLLREDRLFPLRTLVGLDRVPAGDHGRILDLYNQSYALVTWMCRVRRGELRDYLLSMLRERPGRPAPQRHLELFEQAFGDVDRLERAWLGQETARLSPHHSLVRLAGAGPLDDGARRPRGRGGEPSP